MHASTVEVKHPYGRVEHAAQDHISEVTLGGCRKSVCVC